MWQPGLNECVFTWMEMRPFPFLSARSNSSSIAFVWRRSFRLLPTMNAAIFWILFLSRFQKFDFYLNSVILSNVTFTLLSNSEKDIIGNPFHNNNVLWKCSSQENFFKQKQLHSKIGCTVKLGYNKQLGTDQTCSL